MSQAKRQGISLAIPSHVKVLAFLFLLGSTSVHALPGRSGGGPFPERPAKCERYLEPRYANYPNLANVRDELATELKIQNHKVYEVPPTPGFEALVAVELMVDGVHYSAFFPFSDRSRRLEILQDDLTRTYRGKEIDISLSNDNLKPKDHAYYEKVFTLSLLLAISATFPEEKDVALQVDGLTMSNDGPDKPTRLLRELSSNYSVEELLANPELAINQLSVHRVLDRLGFTKYVEPPTLRHLKVAGEDEYGEYDFQYEFSVRAP